MIPQNIKNEHIIKAIEEVEKSGIPKDRSSDRYDLEYNKRYYPPKYIISIANKYANGNDLDHSEFLGGSEANDFLESLGFNIVNKQIDFDEDDTEEQTHDFAPRLKDYLENIYSIEISKGRGRAQLSFPSGAIINVRGSVTLKDNRGFYHLQKDDYNEILDNANRYFAVVFGNPEKTFVFTKESLRNFFSNTSAISQEGKKPKWYFDIREDNDRYYLKVHSPITEEQNIDNHLNRWDQIEDFKPFYEETYKTDIPNYWIFVVTDKSEQDLNAKQILATRMEDKLWGLNAKTPSRTLLRKNDRVVFSYGAKEFLGTGILDSDPFELTEEQRNQFSHDNEFLKTNFGVRLRDTEFWQDPKHVSKYVDVLSFIKNKKRYMSHFQGGIRKLSKEDYDSILSISQSKKTFVDLQRFLLEEMQMQANYQPIMVRTLLESGGKATINQITSKIQELNPDKTDADLKNIPVYYVLENRGIVRKKNNNQFILNSEDLNEDQCQQLIALCNWKIHNISLQLEELIRAFDKNRNLFDIDRSPEELERVRLSFVSAFPLEKLLQLQLDDYVVGKPDPETGTVDKSTFCYRLENEMKKLSSFPVRASLDFGIYYSRKREGYDYKNKEKYSSPQEAFDAVKSELYSILKAGEQYHIDHDISTLLSTLERKYNINRPIISKILSIYYPDDFVQIHVSNVLESILQSFRTSVNNFNGRFFMAQAHLLEIKNSHPMMRQWSTSDFSHFLWRAIITRDESMSEQEDEDDNSRPQTKQEPTVFVTAYDNSNLNRSKELGILGWRSNSKLLSPGDYIFVFNKSTLDIDSCFRIKSKSDNMDMIWSNELESNQLIYKNRWNAKLISGNLRIPLEDINNMPPFNKESFQLRLRGNFPMPLNSPSLDNKYEDFCNFLLNKINHSLSEESEESDKSMKQTNLQLKDWHLLTVYDIDQIIQNVLQGDKREKKQTLAIPRETVRRIIIHLISSKHVILVGPPGTGKTDLARRLLRELSERIIGSSSPVEAVASYEWGRYEVIGGNSLQGDNYVFHFGCVTKAIKEQKLLLIDEFNRADMNKAFGEMFLAMDHEIIQLREDEKQDVDLLLYNGLKNTVTIPKKFRMICTMNDYDKSLLNELSYGLLRRFAFVEIDAPSNKYEEIKVVMERVETSDIYSDFNELITDEVTNVITPYIDKFLNFILKIRNKRKLGVSTSIDVAKYIAAGYALTNKSDLAEDGNSILWKLLNEALEDYLLPQLDRLDPGTLVYVKDEAYKTLLDDHGNVPDTIRKGFISKLENMISNLEYINGLFATPTNEDI
jgi:MoxR-like ATPase